ncbi:MAG: class I adenylate-forming enzyme family protein [Alphaproteobacteria bacterium]
MMFLAQNTDQQGGAIVDLHSGHGLNASDLAVAVTNRAAAFAALGLGAGDTVALAHGGTPDFFVDLLALWEVGSCVACLNQSLTEAELETVTAFLKPALVIRDPKEKLPKGRHGGGRSGAQRLDDPALILFTSGTTGDPKGVVHSFRSLAARLTLNRQAIGDDTLQNSLCLLPTHFGHGLIGNGLTPLAAGGTLYLYQGIGPQTAAGLGQAISDNHIGFLSSVPSLWKLALRASKPPKAETLKRVHIGSAPLSADLWTSVQTWAGTSHVINAYGITETCNWIGGANAATHTPEDGLVGEVWGGEAAVLDAEGNLSRAGEGEIVVLTASLMNGYLNRPDLTDAAFHKGWFRTGDIGSVGTDGIIRLSGRAKDEINRAGIKIQPAEIDMLLERHPDVVEACAFAWPDPIAGEVVGIALVAAEGASLSRAVLGDWCAKRIKKESIPEKWFTLPAIPRTDRGKIRRDMVRDAAKAEGIKL